MRKSALSFTVRVPVVAGQERHFPQARHEAVELNGGRRVGFFGGFIVVRFFSSFAFSSLADFASFSFFTTTSGTFNSSSG